MIVVSDTSPVNYLVIIELQDLLPKLFDRVLISDAVHRELQSIGAPEPIKRFLDEFPDWLAVQSSPDISPALRHLDAGERGAIARQRLQHRRRRRQALSPGLPHCGIAVTVHHSSDDDMVVDEPEVQGVREMRDQGPPLVAVNAGKCHGKQTNSFDGRVDRFSKALAKFGMACFEPALSLEHFALSGRAKDYRAVH